MKSLYGFALLLSGLCHDVEHPGRTNQFEINSLSSLAIRYNDLSVLENHHIATTFKILMKEGRNMITTSDDKEFRLLRRCVIENILATDMKEHFLVNTKIEEKFEKAQAINKSFKDFVGTGLFFFQLSIQKLIENFR